MISIIVYISHGVLLKPFLNGRCTCCRTYALQGLKTWCVLDRFKDRTICVLFFFFFFIALLHRSCTMDSGFPSIIRRLYNNNNSIISSNNTRARAHAYNIRVL